MTEGSDAKRKLEETLRSAGAEAVPGKTPIFELGEVPDPETLERLLDIVRDFDGTPYLLPSDDPRHEAPEYDWVNPDSDTWELPEDAPSGALLDGLLADGAWRVYVAGRPAPAEDVPDLFRGPTIAALDFLERYGATVVIDAWHDNTQWRVALLAE